MPACESLPPAWQPLTPRGVATFARATPGRLWLVQSLVALLVAAAGMWLLHDGVFPTVRSAIEQLPTQGEIRAGRLDWGGDSPCLLAEGRFLAFSVDLERTGDIRSPAHVQIEFGRSGFRVYSLLGYAECRYPSGWIVALNREELAPWWGAWQPALLALAGALTVVGLLLIWSMLATLYFLPVWLVGFFTNRDLSLRGSWRLAGAALMPGALLMAAAIGAYDFGWMDLVQLGFVTAAHLGVGWIYLILGPLFLPRLQATATRKNPFNAPRE